MIKMSTHTPAKNREPKYSIPFSLTHGSSDGILPSFAVAEFDRLESYPWLTTSLPRTTGII
jgi:hypothetical protein